MNRKKRIVIKPTKWVPSSLMNSKSPQNTGKESNKHPVATMAMGLSSASMHNKSLLVICFVTLITILLANFNFVQLPLKK